MIISRIFFTRRGLQLFTEEVNRLLNTGAWVLLNVDVNRAGFFRTVALAVLERKVEQEANDGEGY